MHEQQWLTPCHTYGSLLCWCHLFMMNQRCNELICAPATLSQDLKINFDGFITHKMPFSDINKAIQLLEEGKSLRCVLHLWWTKFTFEDSPCLMCYLQKLNVQSSVELYSSHVHQCYFACKERCDWRQLLAVRNRVIHVHYLCICVVISCVIISIWLVWLYFNPPKSRLGWTGR